MLKSRALAAAVMLTALAGCAQSSAEGETSTASCADERAKEGLTVQFTTVPCPVQGGKASTAQITVKDSAGATVQDATVKLNYDMPSMNMGGAQHQQATHNGSVYESKLVLGMGGHWVVHVEVTRGSSAPTIVSFPVKAK